MGVLSQGSSFNRRRFRVFFGVLAATSQESWYSAQEPRILKENLYFFMIGLRCGDVMRRWSRAASSWVYPTIPPWRFNTFFSCTSVWYMNNLVNGIFNLSTTKSPHGSSAFICAAVARRIWGDCAWWSTSKSILTFWGYFPSPRSGMHRWTVCALAWVLYHKSR